MANERLPIAQFIEAVGSHSNGVFSLDRFRNHVAPLGIEAKGDVLIIGPGEMMEEVAVIEPAIAGGKVKSVSLIGSFPALIDSATQIASKKYHMKFHHLPGYLAQYLDANPRKAYDTMIFIGNNTLPTLLLAAIADHLKPKGHLYLTVNRQFSGQLLAVTGCRVELIPGIPKNPNHDWREDYFGIVISKEG